jgi:hypothetical protein
MDSITIATGLGYLLAAGASFIAKKRGKQEQDSNELIDMLVAGIGQQKNVNPEATSTLLDVLSAYSRSNLTNAQRAKLAKKIDVIESAIRGDGDEPKKLAALQRASQAKRAIAIARHTKKAGLRKFVPLLLVVFAGGAIGCAIPEFSIGDGGAVAVFPDGSTATVLPYFTESNTGNIVMPDDAPSSISAYRIEEDILIDGKVLTWELPAE